MKIRLLTISATLLALFSTDVLAFDWKFYSRQRGYIHLVGSSTVSPLMAAVAEEFSRSQAVSGHPIQTPVVESTGTVAGFELFCEGTGMKYPDFVNASRPISEKEIRTCYKNGIHDVVEIKIGYDGIVIAGNKSSKNLNLTKKQLFLALAEKTYDKKSGKLIENPNKLWSDVDPKLPKIAITVYGPPLTSGTRDIFNDLIMEESCMEDNGISSLFKNHQDLKEQCHKIRNDGVFIAAGENDDNIVRSLKTNPNALGIFGFNFLVVNPAKIKPVKIDGVLPTYATITSKQYDLSRPLFVYFKKENLDAAPEIRNFIKEIINKDTIGKDGYLVHNGLVALSNLEISNLRKRILPEIE